jgi:chromosome segregation ATPase
MKNFLQNLLIVFSMLLCVLIAWQWVRETRHRKEVESLSDTIGAQTEIIQGMEETARHNNDEIVRLDDLKTRITDTVRSNEARILALSNELEKVRGENEQATLRINAYKDAVDRANSSIRTQNQSILKQNEELAKLMEERNGIAARFNKLAQDYNDLVAKWNQQQEELAAAASTTSSVPSAPLRNPPPSR